MYSGHKKGREGGVRIAILKWLYIASSIYPGLVVFRLWLPLSLWERGLGVRSGAGSMSHGIHGTNCPLLPPLLYVLRLLLLGVRVNHRLLAVRGHLLVAR